MAATAPDTLVNECISNLERNGALVVEVGDTEDVIALYYKSGGGMDGVVNAVPEIAAVSGDAMQNNITLSYQTWVKADLGIASRGEIWFNNAGAAGKLLPFNSEHLVIVLSDNDIVAGMPEAQGPGRYLFGQLLAEAKHPSMTVAVYVINKEFKQAAPRTYCGPDCRC